MGRGIIETGDSMNEAYNMDCMEAMRAMSDNAFDLAIVDPPYGIGENGNKNYTRSNLATAQNYKAFYGDDARPPDADYFSELIRISKNQIIFGANHFISKIPIDSPCWIAWDKENGANDFADFELAWTSFKTAARKFSFRWQGMLQGNMANKELRIHPTQKPIALYMWILTNYAKQGDKILDTHLGSGSSRIAAYNLGFDFTGYEIDADYFAAQEERFLAHTAQQNLFLEA